MRWTKLASYVAVALTPCLAEINKTQDISQQILPDSFVPPQVFQHANLVRTISLAKSYAKETVNVVVENISKDSQSSYYVPFDASIISRIGSFEVREKNVAETHFDSPKIVEYDAESSTQYYKIDLPQPLAAKEKITLTMSWIVLSALDPLPAEIDQLDRQYVLYRFSAYSASAYDTIKQKTNLKLPTSDVPDFTRFPNKGEGKEDPQRQGSTFTYGPYADIPAGAVGHVAVRYEFTKPLLHASLLERDIEVSHWGGNLATEERYWFENRGAKLKSHFSRVKWQQSQYQNPPSSAAKELTFPLPIGSLDPYFIDDIGNVSTSRFRSNLKEAKLELKPRYPVFGGWKYSFRIGWDNNLRNSLRKLGGGDSYVLKVPFIEGPKQNEGVEYERVVVRIVLPEGAA